MPGIQRRASAGQSHFYQHRHPNAAPSTRAAEAIDDDGAGGHAAPPGAPRVSERQPVVAAPPPSLAELQETQRQLEQAQREHREFRETATLETGIGPTVSAIEQRPQAASPPATTTWSVWAAIPLEPLKKTYARLKSSAGQVRHFSRVCFVVFS